ncbi:DNA-formamidopyrimidine glycosylase family protein [Microbacterium luticocti]|uniref:DNA-formamidopyrimidine glycosylase family protein n=1 Tax=Microbacterium luticocti TaxID=451764 RepID=UPI0004097D4D|nr:DNA-formamidopyrimidine glycosylase family protein [Microbacterium luticocti]
MPESPEVAALVEQLDERARGCVVAAVDLLEFRALKTRARPLSSLVGRRIAGVHRFGKFIDVALDDGHLVVSLGRHGWVRWTDASPQGDLDDPAPDAPARDASDRGASSDESDESGASEASASTDTGPPVLAELDLDGAGGGAVLAFTDAGSWVSLGLWVVDDPHDVPGIAKLGPDPLEPGFSDADVDRAVVGRRKQLKAILQEQESFAGIGNAYSDEILHAARLSPLVHGDTLTADERRRLSAAMRDVLVAAADARRGIPIDALTQAKADAMRVHGRAGRACPVCGDTVHDLAFGGTTAQYCPTCQTAGEILG